jgi:glycosyltransferase involved in cell wall biosynthesis
MTDLPTASIIISNYNYARFLPDAIGSALSQTYPRVEVVVVDDGSTDHSRGVILGYSTNPRVVPVLKPNGGMASAWNAGFAASRGDVVVFLDADDVLLPQAIERAVHALDSPVASKVHWPLWEVDVNLNRLGLIPRQPLPEGDLRDQIIRDGPDAVASPPIHGNAWSRRFLEEVFPMPEGTFRQHSDTYLYTLGPAFGPVRLIPEPLGCYRMHGGNDYACRPFDEKNRRNLELFTLRARLLSDYLARKGISIEPQSWERADAYYGWMCRLDRAAEEIKSVVPEGSTFIFVDDAQLNDGWGKCEPISGRRALPFLERNGTYWGPPPNDAAAIEELTRQQEDNDADFFAVAWPAFWWMDYYPGLRQHLRGSFACVLESERVILFDLRRGH